MEFAVQRFVKISFLTLAITCSVSVAWATSVPTAVNPGQVEKRFDNQKPAPASTSIEAPAMPAPALSAEEKKELSASHFTLKAVNVKGSTVFTPEQLKSSYADLLGKNISMLDARGIASRVTSRYRENRYVLSSAKVAGVSGGTLTIQVTEGYVGNVDIVGVEKGSAAYNTIATYGEQIKKQRPVNLNDIERTLLLMSDTPGATAKGALRLTKQPGVADLVIAYSVKPYEVSYTIDNKGSKYIGPIQHTASFVANSLFGNADRTQLRFITTSPTTELRFVDLQHDEALGSSGARWGVTGSMSITHPGDSLKATDIVGESFFLQARASYPVIRTRQENLSTSLMFDTRNVDLNILDSVPFSADRLRVLRAGASYDFADHFHGVNLIDAQISEGFNILGATDSGANRSNPVGSSDFTKFNLDVSRTHILPNNFSVFTAAFGQYSLDKLLVAEQFTLGGNSFGAAYDPSELSGDYGAAGKIELRYSHYMGAANFQGYQLYGFYDIGKVWQRGASSANDKSLSSTGLGIRTYFTPWLSGYVEGALPLSRDVANQGSHGEDPRVFFSLTASY
jgi:hemolysin activation/secretion protein